MVQLPDPEGAGDRGPSRSRVAELEEIVKSMQKSTGDKIAGKRCQSLNRRHRR